MQRLKQSYPTHEVSQRNTDATWCHLYAESTKRIRFKDAEEKGGCRGLSGRGREANW